MGREYTVLLLMPDFIRSKECTPADWCLGFVARADSVDEAVRQAKRRAVQYWNDQAVETETDHFAALAVYEGNQENLLP